MADRNVLITGTSTGIGAACVQRMAGSGWRVYAGVRREEDGERLAADADAGAAGEVVPVLLDVVDRGHVDAALARIRDEAGVLHGLVNNAGIGVGGPIELLTDEEWRRQFDVNFFSLVSLTREAMPLMEDVGGRFVHIGSIAGRVSQPALGPYAASKHAVEAFNWSLRGELARTSMNSSVVEPGEIKTAIWDKADDTIAGSEARIDAAGRRARYGFLIQRQRAFNVEGREKGIDPDRVAQAVEHALTASRPKARYLVGPDAKLIGLMARLPDRVLEPLLGLNGRRLERAGRKLV
ncbi:MAG: SDR family NAD(P)-dependent oxidoreductase [Acidimicrobiales bacterium]